MTARAASNEASAGRGATSFEISVFSNPLGGLVEAGASLGLTLTDIEKTVRLDEQLVKPAMFLADRVILHSHRLDLMLSARRNRENTNREVPLLAQYVGESKLRNPELLALLGLTQAALLSPREIELFEEIQAEQSRSHSRWMSAAKPTNADRYRAMRDERKAEVEAETLAMQPFLDRSQIFRAALAALYLQAEDRFTSAALNRWNAGGLLAEEPWDHTPRSRPRQLIDSMVGPTAEFDRAFAAMADDVASSSRSVMVDARTHDHLATVDRAVAPSSVVAGGAVSLMSMIDGLSDLPLDEVLDVRSELSDYLVPFRGFLLEVAKDADLTAMAPFERDRTLQQAWATQVAPAVAELEGHLRSASFVRNAIDIFTSSDVLVPVGTAVGVAFGAHLIGLPALSGSVAVAQPLLQAFMRTVRGREAEQQNRAYFVHAFGEARRKK